MRKIGNITKPVFRVLRSSSQPPPQRRGGDFWCQISQGGKASCEQTRENDFSGGHQRCFFPNFCCAAPVCSSKIRGGLHRRTSQYWSCIIPWRVREHVAQPSSSPQKGRPHKTAGGATGRASLRDERDKCCRRWAGCGKGGGGGGGWGGGVVGGGYRL